MSAQNMGSLLDAILFAAAIAAIFLGLVDSVLFIYYRRKRDHYRQLHTMMYTPKHKEDHK